MAEIITRILQPVKNNWRRAKNRIGKTVSRFPLLSFFGLMAVLVVLAVIGDRLRTVKPSTEEAPAVAKDVTVFEVGQAPTLTVEAKVEKSGVIKLVAQTAGVVQQIKTKEGDAAKRGSSLFILSSNYQGANAPALTRKLSQVNYQYLLDTHQAQVDLIHRSQEIARRGETQASELRSINRQSIDDTKGIITINEQILSSLDDQIKQLEVTNVNGSNDAALLQARQGRAGILSGLANLRASLRATEYLNNNDEEAAQIAVLSRDNTLQQLDLQEKALNLGQDIAHLNLRLAQINESLMYPASPITGTVERIHVKVGQSVAPGTLLATIKGDKNTATAVVMVSRSVAETVSRLEPSYAVAGDQRLAVLPRSISDEPTDGALHSIIYTLPESIGSLVSNDSFVEMELPMSAVPAGSEDRLFIPLDAIYQSQNKASVNIIDGQKAKNIDLVLGEVTGQYVEVISGINPGDRVIINRNVVAGELVNVL